MIEIEYNKKSNEFLVKDPSDVTALLKGFFGTNRKGVVVLNPLETMYIMEIRNGEVRDENENIYTFNDIATLISKDKKAFAKYLTYKDWRDKGLILKPFSELSKSAKYNRNQKVKYPVSGLNIDKISVSGLFFRDDIATILDDPESGKYLYETYWIGQRGTYKSPDRGNTSKLDVYETLFLMDYGGLSLKNADKKDVLKLAMKRIPFFKDRYDVYKDWRLKGYVTKTGFKFGTHFRIYVPGALPTLSSKKWIHSRHVVHVFSRKDKLIISEWARAIRVAHSVKKTFILAIPGKKSVKKENLDFVLYHRKKGKPEDLRDGKPRYLMYSLSEEEYIGGEELASALETCEHHQLNMLMAIADRETSITYYLIKKLILPGSNYDYFEIKWVQP